MFCVFFFLFFQDRTLGIQWCESKLWFRYSLARTLAPRLSGYQDARDKMRRCMDVLREIVKKHQETMHQREVSGEG